MQRLPNVAGLKNEVIVPQYSHNVYDHAARMLGVKLVIVQNKAELEPAFNERTAMVIHPAHLHKSEVRINRHSVLALHLLQRHCQRGSGFSLRIGDSLEQT